MGPTPILEMARAYGLRPRLWLLNTLNLPQNGGIRVSENLKFETFSRGGCHRRPFSKNLDPRQDNVKLLPLCMFINARLARKIR